jgi:hypothetical protein
MNKFIGTEVEIFYVRGEEDDYYGYNIFVQCEDAMIQWVNNKKEMGWWFPRGCLELASKEKSVTHVVGSCPRCGGELKDKVSEYTGTVVKKCKCGWCN